MKNEKESVRIYKRDRTAAKIEVAKEGGTIADIIRKWRMAARQV